MEWVLLGLKQAVAMKRWFEGPLEVLEGCLSSQVRFCQVLEGERKRSSEGCLLSVKASGTRC